MVGHTPTPEQQAILGAAAGTGHLMIKAYAGCTKTTVLEMIAHTMPHTRGLYLVFNVRNKKEAEKRFPPNFTVLTMNGLGHRAWGRAIRQRLTLDDRKLGRLVTQIAKDERVALSPDHWDAVRIIVSGAQQRGLVPTGLPFRGLIPDTEESWVDIADETGVDPKPWPLARLVLNASIGESFRGIVSFDDQIYCSALLGGIFEPYPTVLGDEVQDWSLTNHLQVQRVSVGGRLVLVGDPKQSVYAFRGADSSSMTKARALRSEWVDLPLTTTFRCPKAIVARNQNHAPGFTAWHSNQEGTVHNMVGKAWGWPDIQATAQGASVAILCRNVAPLMSMAFALLRQKVPVVMLGRDIGKGLAALVRKICSVDDTPAAAVAIMITNWMTEEISKAEAADRPTKAEGIRDRGESLLAVLEASEAVDAKALRAAIVALFAQEHGRATLATIHRAKGAEWPFVVHLDPWRIPSRQAKAAMAAGNPVPMDQELNLNYVAETRAQETLILANMEDFT